MRSNGERGFLALLWPVAIVASFLVGRLGPPSDRFSWDPKISVVQALTLLTTILISVAFFRTIERHKYVDKLRKDALINALDLVKQKVEELQAASEKATPEYSGVVVAIRQLRGEFATLTRLAKALDLPVEDDSRKRFLRAWSMVNRLLTYTPSDADIKSPNDLRVESGKLHVPIKRRLETASAIEDMRHFLLELRARVILAV